MSRYKLLIFGIQVHLENSIFAKKNYSIFVSQNQIIMKINYKSIFINWKFLEVNLQNNFIVCNTTNDVVNTH